MHLRTRVRALLSMLSAFALACAGPESAGEVLTRHSVPSVVPGCYALATGHDTAALGRARLFRLDADPVSATHRDLHPATSLVDSTRERVSLWSADSLSDTVRVSIGDGFTGVTAIVVASPTGLRGRAIGYGDAGPSESVLGEVEYARRPCPTEG